MSRTALFAALAAASTLFGANTASAGTVFDFVPRMDFYDQPEVVQKDKADLSQVCAMTASGKTDCVSNAKIEPVVAPESTDK